MPADATTDFGTDLLWVDDLDPTHRLVSGVALVGQAIYHRLITPRGRMIDDANYGLGLIEHLHKAQTPVQLRALQTLISAEALKDERVESCTAVLTDLGGGRVDIQLSVECSAGPFKLILSADVTLGSIIPEILGQAA